MVNFNKIFLSLILFYATSFAQRTVLYGGGIGNVYAADLDGSTEYMSNSSPVNLDLNDTNRVVYAIDNDFELGELVTNSSFTTDSDWAKTNGWSIAGGKAVCVSTGTALLSQNVGFETGKTYRITLDVDAVTIFIIYFGNSGLGQSVSFTGTFSFEGQSSGEALLYFRCNDGESATIDNVFITEISNYTATGNHSFDSTSVDPLTGSYSGLITSSTTGGDSVYVFLGTQGKGWDITTSTQTLVFNFEANENDDYIRIYFSDTGDSTTNYAELSETYYEPMVAGEKYTLQFQMKGTSDVVNDTIRFDEVDLSEAYDITILYWAKSNSSGEEFVLDYANAGTTLGYVARMTAGGEARFNLYPDHTAVSSTTLDDNVWHLVAFTIDRAGNLQIYIDGISEGSGTDITELIRISFTSETFFLGGINGSNSFDGLIGETQIIRGQILTASQILTAFQRGQAGKHFLETGNEVAWYKFKGSDNATFLSDETGNNDLTGTNVTQSDDQLKLKKYKD